jgi:hypothetical protein
MFHSINTNDHNSTTLITNGGIKPRMGTTTYERLSSAPNDAEHNTNDSISTIINNNNNSSTTSLSNSDEKENRRIIDIQCKLKTKETRSCLVKKISY